MKFKSTFHGLVCSRRRRCETLMSAFAAILITMLVVACAPLSAMAQAVACIPPPTNRTPGLPGPPDWIGTFNPPVKTGLDDPRWMVPVVSPGRMARPGTQPSFKPSVPEATCFCPGSLASTARYGAGKRGLCGVHAGRWRNAGKFRNDHQFETPLRLLRTRTLPPTIRRLIPSVRLEFPPALRVWA